MNKSKLTTASCVVATLISLSGCELLGPVPLTKLPLPPVPKDLPNQQPGVVFKDLQNKPASTDTKRAKVETFPGTNRYVPEIASQSRITPATNGKGTYSLNFDEADLGEVAKVVLGDILGRNYVLSPKVAGKVTLQTTEPLSKEELLPTLEMVLRMNNAVLIKDESIYHIEPIADALNSSEFSGAGNMGRAGYQVKVIPVKNVAVEELVEVIKPLLQEKTILNVDGTRNIIVASGTRDELNRVMDMVSTFDVDILKGRSFALFQLAHVEPETIIGELEEVFDKKGSGDDSSFFRFIPIERLNAVLAITHQANYLRDIESWVLRLDRANTVTGGGVNVYRVQHVNAVELADTLNNIFGSGGGGSSDRSAKLAPGKKSKSLSNKSSATDKTDTSASAKKSANNSTQRQAKQTSSGSGQTGDTKVANVGEVKIIADEANNAVVVVATAQEYEIIRSIISQLDVMPLQVLIDATIVSVDLKDDLKYGIQWFFDHGGSNVGSGLGQASIGDLTMAAAKGFATGGLSAAYNSGAVNALLTSQAAKGNVNVISSPSLMVLNNQEATIDVGTQIPTLASTLSGAGINTGTTGSNSSGLVTNSQISYKDTGVKLEVTPRVNANGMVIMEIKQSVSDPVESTIGVTSSAAIAKKEIESSVAVQDGETIVLGGLIKETNTYNKSGIPWMHEVPWIGPLFGNTTNNKDKTELVVLITPRVVKSKQDSRVISDEFKRKLSGIYQTTRDVAVPPRR